MGLERRQPSQDFGLIIADRNVMIILYVETVDAVTKRTIIKILGVGGVGIIVLRFREPGVPKI